MPLESRPDNIRVKGIWKREVELCRKVESCYATSFANMVLVVMHGIYLDTKGNEYTEYIFNGHLMGLTRGGNSARLGNHNPTEYITGTFNAAKRLSRQIGVYITVTGGDPNYSKHRINFTK